MEHPKGQGTIPDGWQRVRLREVLELEQPGAWGEDPTPDEPSVRVLRAADLTRDGRVNPANAAWRRLSRRDLERRLMRHGDLILERSGGGPGTPVGRVALVEGLGAVYCNNFCQQLRVDQRICTPKYAARALWHRYTQGATTRLEHQTTGIRNLDYAAYLDLPVLLPPLPEQRAIAAVLDSIDDAIEGAEAVIAATEQLRDSLLHDLLTRGLPGQHTEWRDVPGLGTIPADWDVVRLGDVGEWHSGGTPSKARQDFWDGPIPWVSPKNMKVREINDSADRISEEAAGVGSRMVPEGSILIVVRGMILVHSLPVAITGVPCAFNQDIRALISDKKFSSRYVLAALESLKAKMLDLVTPSTHGTMRIVSEDLHDIRIPVPPMTEQQAIAAVLKGVDEAIEVAHTEHDRLRLVKESTADAVLTGRIRV